MALKESITREMEQLEVGGIKEFPAERIVSVRATACILGFKLNRKFRTQIDRDKRVVVVIRDK